MQWSCVMNNDAHRPVCFMVVTLLILGTGYGLGCHQATNPWEDTLAATRV